jgi:predicted DNA-binding transcriptional regulator AlpA
VLVSTAIVHRVSTGVGQWYGHVVEPVGALEIAGRLGVERETVVRWRKRGLLPEPRWTVSGNPAWEWRDVERWAERTGRLRKSD